MVYASAGHPPAVLLSGKSATVQRLKTPSMPVGMFEDVQYMDLSCQIEPDSNLYIFSDGIYEIQQPDGNIWGIDAFINLLISAKKSKNLNLDFLLQQVETIAPKDSFDDDVSILEISFD